MGYFDATTTILPLPSDPRNADAEPSSDGTHPAGYWVEIKDELDFGDTNYRNKRIVRLSSKGLAGAIADANAEWEIDQFSQATLERAIIAWNLSDVPPTPASIQKLRQADAAFILREVMQRNVVPGSDAEGSWRQRDYYEALHGRPGQVPEAARLSDLAKFFNCSVFDVPRLPPRLVLQADEWLEVKYQIDAGNNASQAAALADALRQNR